MTEKSLEKQVVLVTVSGKDAPGITSSLTKILAASDSSILDIGQSVIHGQLSLSILFAIESAEARAKTTLKDLLFKATELGMKLQFEVMDQADATTDRLAGPKHRYAITLLAERVPAAALHEVTRILAVHDANIDSVKRLSEEDFACVEIVSSSSEAVDVHRLKTDLLAIAKDLGVDIALQQEGLYRRAKRLVVFDMDSTLIQSEVIDELARERGVFNDVAAVTERAMQGKMDFDESLRERCKFLKGAGEEDMDHVFRRLKLTPGAADLIKVLKRLGYKVALISGGFQAVASRFKDELGLDYAYANHLEYVDGVCTGEVRTPIVNAQRKADLLDVIAQQEEISLDQVIAVGDGANDLLMLERAGLGIAFNAKAVVRERADLAISQKNLSSILHLLGFSGRDVADVLS